MALGKHDLPKGKVNPTRLAKVANTELEELLCCGIILLYIVNICQSNWVNKR